MEATKITRNYQITIPSEIRIAKKLKIGDRVKFNIRDGKVEIEKIGKDAILASAGIWNEIRGSSADYVRKMRKEWDRRANY